MKRNILSILAVLSISILFCSYSHNDIKTVRGYIRVYGNEPFTFIGIKTADKKEYTIIAEDNVCKELINSQGQMVEITGILIKKNKNTFDPGILKDGKIEVTEWTILQ